jgi:CBS domain-containing protein
MQIQDVMTADVSFVEPHTSILEIARKMRDGDIGSTLSSRTSGSSAW